MIRRYKVLRYKPVLYLRYALQGISLVFFIFGFTNLVFPLGWQATLLQWFSRIDPWLLMSHLRWQHSIPVWGWLPLMTLVITLLFGRVFCGWLCPFGALLMLVDKVGRILLKNRLFRKIALIRTKTIHKLQPIRYFWLLFLVVIFVLGSNWTFFLTPFALFSHELVRILRGAVPWALIVIIASTLLFSRFWCSVLCPTGILLSLIGRLRLFRYQVSDKCVQCSKCTQICSVGAAPEDTGVAKEGCMACGECQSVCPTKAVKWHLISHKCQKGEKELETSITTEAKNEYSRRQFLEIALTATAAAALWRKTVLAAKQVLRPPGALQEAEFTSVCNRCGRCIKVCPNNALQPMPITEGIESFETPYIIPRNANCNLCFACQEVCPTGAITQVTLEKVQMGKATINKNRCLAWKENKLCFICGEQCPVLAIEGDDQHRPTVSYNCVGCGTCERNCPVDGEAAIRVSPK